MIRFLIIKWKKEKMKFLYWWLPLLSFVIFIVWENCFHRPAPIPLHTEEGAMEYFQAFLSLAAFLLAVFAFFRSMQLKHKLFMVWTGLAALGSFYIFGEELSWGQHLLGWETSDAWKQVNDQHETNFHNTSSWLDQKPRLILELSIVFSGFVYPLVSKYKQIKLPTWIVQLMPPVSLWLTAFLVEYVSLFERVIEFFPRENRYYVFERASEIQEFYMYYFIAVYLLWFIQNRLNKA